MLLTDINHSIESIGNSQENLIVLGTGISIGFVTMHPIEEWSDREEDCCESYWDQFVRVMYGPSLPSPAGQVPLKIIVGRQFAMSLPQKCALWEDWWDYVKKARVILDEDDEPPLKLQVKEVICNAELDVLRAIAIQVLIDFWNWFWAFPVYPQPRIDRDILVLIADKLSEYAGGEVNDLIEDEYAGGVVNDLIEDVWGIIRRA